MTTPYTGPTGGTPPPVLPPNPTKPMVSCDSCQGGYPVVNMFPMQPPGGGPSCPPGWIPSGSGNPCVSTPTPPPPPPMANCQTCSNGTWQINQFPTPNGQCPPGWEIVDGSSPCNVLGEPGISNTFVNNISSGYNQFGCSFLYNRLAVQEQKLAQLQAAGTNPQWQDMIENRIIYIEGMIAESCTMTYTNGPNGTTLPNPGPIPNQGPTIQYPEMPAQPAQAYIQAQAAQPYIPAQPAIPANAATGQPYIPAVQGQPYIPAVQGQPYIPAVPAVPGQTAVSGPTMAFNGFSNI